MNLMEQYSNIYGIDIKEIKTWINDYANAKNIPDGMDIENTKDDRIAGIKQYIQSQVDDSITGRIKYKDANLKLESSVLKNVCECPF